MRKIRTDVYFTDEQRKKLSKVAKAHKVGVATILRDIVDKALGIETAPVEINLPVLDLKQQAATK
jgi:hypothetical protein